MVPDSSPLLVSYIVSIVSILWKRDCFMIEYCPGFDKLWIIHYNDVIMGMIASQITSLMIVY